MQKWEKNLGTKQILSFLVVVKVWSRQFRCPLLRSSSFYVRNIANQISITIMYSNYNKQYVAYYLKQITSIKAPTSIWLAFLLSLYAVTEDATFKPFNK